MKDVYARLAKRLDEMPNGFPPTENGVEIKILKKIYSPDDAEMALKLKNMPETSSQVAARLNMPEDEAREILDKMAVNGQIASFKLFGQQVYMLFPFAVGIYEFQLNRIDREFAEMVEEYAPVLFRTLGGYRPELGRVIPVNLDMELKTQVNTYEDVTKIIERSKSFKVQECICRKERACSATHVNIN